MIRSMTDEQYRARLDYHARKAERRALRRFIAAALVVLVFVGALVHISQVAS